MKLQLGYNKFMDNSVKATIQTLCRVGLPDRPENED